MGEDSLLLSVEDEVATLTLNRPDVHNAFNDELIERLSGALEDIGNDATVRAVVLAGRGKSFCAGADLNWMRASVDHSETENLADANRLAELLHRLDTLRKPTLALVQGPAMAGGIGLICACDIAIAARSAVFALTEVRLGLIPAMISPYVIGAIGARNARRYFLTGERFDASEAARIGLVHEVVADDALVARGDACLKQLLAGAPQSQAEAKKLIASVRGQRVDQELRARLAKQTAEMRASAEAQTRMKAFLNKRGAPSQKS